MVQSCFNTIKFPDNTSLLKVDKSKNFSEYIVWTYEDDSELTQVMFIARHLKSLGVQPTLIMPYIPNARMDRVHDRDTEVFTLKHFCEFINSLDFKKVLVFDPHSDVSTALLNRVDVINVKGALRYTIAQSSPDIVYFPDAGAMKRYSDIIKGIWCNCNLKLAYGNKIRDWSTGEIKGLEIVGEIPQGAKVLMIDDICSYGGTMYFSAKKLKELGAGDIEMYVSHCENSILDPKKGKVFKEKDLIKQVYTTDSLLTAKHPKIKLMRSFKDIINEANKSNIPVERYIDWQFG